MSKKHSLDDYMAGCAVTILVIAIMAVSLILHWLGIIS